MFIGDCSLSMLDFVDWLGPRQGVVAIFCVFALVFGLLTSLYTSCVLWCALFGAF